MPAEWRDKDPRGCYRAAIDRTDILSISSRLRPTGAPRRWQLTRDSLRRTSAMPAILRLGLALGLLSAPLLLGACATSPCGVAADP
jgi:hypothetical protein